MPCSVPARDRGARQRTIRTSTPAPAAPAAAARPTTPPEPLEPRTLLATFTVTTTAGEGPGSLRQAILDANAAPTTDTIAFNIPGRKGSAAGAGASAGGLIDDSSTFVITCRDEAHQTEVLDAIETSPDRSPGCAGRSKSPATAPARCTCTARRRRPSSTRRRPSTTSTASRRRGAAARASGRGS